MPAGESWWCLPTLLCYVETEFGKEEKRGRCLVCVSKAFAAISSSLGGFLWLGDVVSSLHWAFVESGFDDTAADSVPFILTVHGWSKSKKSLHKYCIFCADIGNELHTYK